MASIDQNISICDDRAGREALLSRSASTLMRRRNARTATSTAEQRRRLELLKRAGRIR